MISVARIKLCYWRAKATIDNTNRHDYISIQLYLTEIGNYRIWTVGGSWLTLALEDCYM